MIALKQVSKTFPLTRDQKKEAGNRYPDGRVHAVDDVSFTCRPGKIYTLLGPNGAGKTTTLRMIATLLRPTSGAIEVAGYDTVKQGKDVRQRLGFLTGSTRLYDRLTAAEVVAYYADLHGMDKARFEKRKDELFSLLDMHSFAKWRIGKLSTGMKQKVSIVRTIIHDPDIVVFDEPTAGLDVITARHIIDLIQRCREEGKTVIFSTHIMGEVSLLSDDLGIIHNGRLIYDGPFQEFVSRNADVSLEEAFIRLFEEVPA